MVMFANRPPYLVCISLVYSPRRLKLASIIEAAQTDETKPAKPAGLPFPSHPSL
jgi:hypothetical protein